MNKLTKRLKLISDLVSGDIIADVGCDHGKLTKELLDKNKINFAYISDISSASLQKAIDLLSSYPTKFQAICCDGLLGYKDAKIDECIIAGMGGYEIMKIIDNSPINIDTFILAPQHDIIELKKYLNNHNFDIDFDIIILDKGKFYNIIKCRRVEYQSQINEFNLYFGKDNFTNPLSDIDKYIDKHLAKFRDIKAKQKSPNDKIDEQIRLFEKAKKELRYE